MRTLRLALALLLAAAPARAAFEAVETGPRAAGLGGAGAAHLKHVTSMFYNPASLMRLNRPEAFAAVENMYQGLADGSLSRQVGAFAMPTGLFGAGGRLGAAYTQFKADSLYSETSLSLAFARPLGERLRFGVAARQMSVKFGADEYTAINPVFDSGASASAIGFDVGLERVGERVDLAFSALNANEPDVGIKYANKVPRRIHVAAAFKGRGWHWTTQVQSEDKDLRFKSGVEHRDILPHLVVRGGIGVGSRDFRQITAGFGYQLGRLTLDYALILPVGGVTGVLGHHLAGVTLRFGDDEDEDLERRAAEDAKAGGGRGGAIQVEVRESAGDLFAAALLAAEKGLLSEALGHARRSLDLYPDDPKTQELETRLAPLAKLAPVVRPEGPAARLRTRGISAAVIGDGKTAIESLLYASQIHPQDKSLAPLLRVARELFPVDAARIKPVRGLTVVDQKMEEALALIYDGNYTAAVALSEEALELQPDHLSALVRQGSAYWAMGRHQTARALWERALRVDPGNEEILIFLKRKVPERKAAPQAVPTAAPAAPDVDPTVRAEFESGLAYYERLKRQGVDQKVLKAILDQFIQKFEGTGVDLTELREERRKY